MISLDGGGIRGILTARLLHRIDEHFPILKADMFAGTSTGGILAIGLAAGYSPEALVEFYHIEGPKIFRRSFLRKLSAQIRRAKYGNENLKIALDAYFKDLTVNDLEKKILIPTFDLDDGSQVRRSWKAKFFHNFQDNHPDNKEFLRDIALATSSAPIFFPTHRNYVDGGVVANNPSMAALAQLLASNYQIYNTSMLSIGTGKNPKFIGANHDWGLFQWSSFVTDIVMDGDVDVARYQAEQVMRDHYHRLNPILDEDIPLDDTGSIPYLIEIADKTDLVPTFEWLEKNWPKHDQLRVRQPDETPRGVS